MRVCLIVKPGHSDSGVGRYAAELEKALKAEGLEVVLAHPRVPLPGWLVAAIQKWPGWDLAAFFSTYPVWIDYPVADLYHFTSQNLASLLTFRRPPAPSLVTVHDLFPYLLDQKGLQPYPHAWARWFDRWSMRGLRAANTLLAVSADAHQAASTVLDIPAERMVIVSEGVA